MQNMQWTEVGKIGYLAGTYSVCEMYYWGKPRDVRNVNKQIILADNLGNLEIDTDTVILNETKGT